MIDDQLLSALRINAEEVLASHCSIEAVHNFINKGESYDSKLWHEIAELGWMSLAVPEIYGGLGGGIRELAMLQQALGARLAPIPFFGTAILTEVLSMWPYENPRRALLPAIAAGSLRGGVGPVHQPTMTALTIKESSSGFEMTGECNSIVDGKGADWLLVPVSTSNGELGVALTSATGSGRELRNMSVADRTRGVSTFSCPAATLESEYIVIGQDAAAILSHIAETAALLIACDSLGGATTIFAITIDWLKTRTQFSKPIGSFQALKHRAADQKVLIEMADMVVQEAVTRSISPTLRGCWPAIAKAQACEAFMTVAADAVQMHGGMGFTWEHQAHFYLKRAALNRHLFGDSTAQLENVAASLLAEDVA